MVSFSRFIWHCEWKLNRIQKNYLKGWVVSTTVLVSMVICHQGFHPNTVVVEVVVVVVVLVVVVVVVIH